MMAIPATVNAMPWNMLSQPVLAISRQPHTSQIRGCIMPMVLTRGVLLELWDMGMAVGVEV
jgi:hypothetical protein